MMLAGVIVLTFGGFIKAMQGWLFNDVECRHIIVVTDTGGD